MGARDDLGRNVCIQRKGVNSFSDCRISIGSTRGMCVTQEDQISPEDQYGCNCHFACEAGPGMRQVWLVEIGHVSSCRSF